MKKLPKGHKTLVTPTWLVKEVAGEVLKGIEFAERLQSPAAAGARCPFEGKAR